MGSSELTGQVALVTGATSGIGAATAALLAERGALVLVAGRDRARGESVVAAIGDRGGRADFVAADLREAESVPRLAREAATLVGGRVDILVNNAGSYPFGPTEQTQDRDTDAVYALAAHAPAGRPGTPQEIAEAIAYLAGDAASFVHGAVLSVDGGRTAV
ncbi:SDR family NAD(P)-dependent oxidoreductase [Streptomyces noursei]|uniref:SDR family NAD(P)-dependent oxidoreductase n=1 Tax=Streptomyces noursei TaxID=1971 RepID=UPI0030F115BA